MEKSKTGKFKQLFYCTNTMINIDLQKYSQYQINLSSRIC